MKQNVYDNQNMQGNVMDANQPQNRFIENISPYAARFGNFFCGFNELGTFDFYGKKASLAFVPDRQNMVSCFVLNVKAGTQNWKIVFETDRILLFHPAVKEYPDLEREYGKLFPEQLKQALLESLFVPLLGVFSQKLGTDFAVTDVVYDADVSDKNPFLSFMLEISDDTNAVFSEICHVIVPEERESLKLLEKLETAFPHDNAGRDVFPFLETGVYFSVGETKLALRDVRELSVGDCVLFDDFYGNNAFIRMYLRGAGTKIRDGGFSENTFLLCAYKDNRAEAVQWVRAGSEGETEMDDNRLENGEENLAQDNVSVQPDFSDLMCSLHFSLGERQITLKELQEIGEGYTFALEHDFLSPVTLLLNGKTVGHGKIVNIGGTVGVQITDLNK